MICMSLKLCIIIVILPLSLLKGNVIFESLRLPLAKGSSTSNQAFSIVFTTPSVPLVGDRNLRRKDVTALLGAQNRYAIRLADQSGLRHIMRDGTAWDNIDYLPLKLQYKIIRL